MEHHYTEKESTLLDIGSGTGRFLLTATLNCGFRLYKGIEVNHVAVDRAKELQRKLFANEQTRNSLMTANFVKGDAKYRKEYVYWDRKSNSRLSFSHVYIFDYVFTIDSLKHIAKNLNLKEWKVLCSTRKSDEWTKYGLKDFTYTDKYLKVKMQGSGQQFTFYFYVAIVKEEIEL